MVRHSGYCQTSENLGFWRCCCWRRVWDSHEGSSEVIADLCFEPSVTVIKEGTEVNGMGTGVLTQLGF